jgi:hypothetical protein
VDASELPEEPSASDPQSEQADDAQYYATDTLIEVISRLIAILAKAHAAGVTDKTPVVFRVAIAWYVRRTNLDVTSNEFILVYSASAIVATFVG